MGVTVVTPPSELPITTSGIRQHLRIGGSADDALLVDQVSAATEFVENYLGRSLMTQTLDYTISSLPTVIELPRSPVQSVTSITVVDEDGQSTVVDGDSYELDTTRVPHRVVKKSNAGYPDVTLSQANPVTVRFVAGYGDASDVPETFKAAIRLLVGNWYENREASLVGVSAAAIPFGVPALLEPHRIHHFPREDR